MTLQAAQKSPADSSKALYGGKGTRRITVHDIAAAKARGEKWPMLTAYDAMTASVFDEAADPRDPRRRLDGQLSPRLRDHRAGHDGRDDVPLRRRRPGHEARPRRRRPPLRLVPGRARPGPAQRHPADQGRGRPRGQAGGRRAFPGPDRAARPGQDPRHVPPRPHPAVRQHDGLPGAGPYRRGRPPAAQRRQGGTGRGRLRGRPRTRTGRAGRRGHPLAAHPDRRHRRGQPAPTRRSSSGPTWPV